MNGGHLDAGLRTQLKCAWRCVLVLLALFGPLALLAGGSPAGSYRMFTRVLAYRISFFVEGATRDRVPMSVVEPHLSRDGRRIIVAADKWFAGDAQVELLAAGLPDLTRLLCKLRPQAARSEVVLEERGIRGGAARMLTHSADCGVLK